MDIGEFSLIPSILVMMSTYNGECFLAEQIDSILNQTNVNVSLIIRDDGSTDNTLSIIRDYCERYSNVQRMHAEENLGPGKSFMDLMYYSFRELQHFDYYAFADQDDIWLADKLDTAINMIKDSITIKIPGLYCSNQMLYFEDKSSRLRFSNQPDMTLAGHLSRNLPSGCTFVMNRALVERVSRAEHAGDTIINRRIHDSWLMLVCLSIGSVVYDEKPHILYRIHANNTVGVKPISAKQRIIVMWKNMTDRDYSNYRSKAANQLLISFPEISGRNREILEEVAYYKHNRTCRRRLIKDTEVLNAIGSFARLKILMGLV